MQNEHLIDIAHAFYINHGKRPGRRRLVALERCTEHLMEYAQVSEDRASHAALLAMAERECPGGGDYIDLERSSTHLVVVARQGRDPLAFTLTDLLTLYQERKLRAQGATRIARALSGPENTVAKRAAANGPDTPRPACPAGRDTSRPRGRIRYGNRFF